MIPVQNLFETHLPVTDLDQSLKFYAPLLAPDRLLKTVCYLKPPSLCL